MRYAVVSCHVERPVDDRVWQAFARVQAERPGGFRIAALMRPPDRGEDERTWLERARLAQAGGPFGHHTHFGGVDRARPEPGEDTVARFRAETDWLRARGLTPRFYCGGGWYMNEALAREVAAAGYVDCSATAFALPWLAHGAPRLDLAEPAWLDVDGTRLLELPTTHSIGGAFRSLARLPAGVHVHFHDWELVDSRRRWALSLLLAALARLRPVLDLDDLADASSGHVQVVRFATVLRR